MAFCVLYNVQNHSEVASVHKFQLRNYGKDFLTAFRVWLNSMNWQVNQNMFFADPLLLSLWLHEAQIEVFQYFHASCKKKNTQVTKLKSHNDLRFFTSSVSKYRDSPVVGQYYFRPR